MEDLVTTARTTVRGGLYILLGNVLSTALLALTSIIVARALGPKDYGLYSLSLVPSSLMATLITLGINSAVINFVARHLSRGNLEEASKFILYGGSYSLLSGTLAALLLVAYSNPLATHLLKRGDLADLVRLTSLALLGQSMLNFSLSTFYGFNNMRPAAILRGFQAGMKLSLISALILYGLRERGAIFGHSLSYLLAGLAGAFAAFRMVKVPLDFKRLTIGAPRGLKQMLAYGLPIYFSSLLLGLTVQISNIILAAYATDVEIGNYSVAFKLLSLLTLLSSPISMTLFPTFSKFDLAKGRDKLGKLLRWSVKYTALLLVPSSTYIMLFSAQLIRLVYGASYVLAPTYLALLAVSYLYAGLGSLAIYPFFNGIGMTRTTLAIAFISSATSISLALPLTLMLRVEGLILANLSGSSAGLAYGLIKLKNAGLKLDLSSSIKIYVVAGSSSLMVWALKALLPLNGGLVELSVLSPVYTFLYFLILPFSGSISLRDVDVLRNIFRGFKPLYTLLSPLLAFEEHLLKLRSKLD